MPPTFSEKKYQAFEIYARANAETQALHRDGLQEARWSIVAKPHAEPAPAPWPCRMPVSRGTPRHGMTINWLQIFKVVSFKKTNW